MSRLVVDASVLAKLYLPEEHSDLAEKALRKPKTELFAPDLLWPEFANIVWKRQRRGDISEAAARAAVTEAVLLPIETVPAGDLVSHALELAMETGRTVYDSLYLAVAISKNGVVLTADERLANGLRAGVFGRFVRWVGEGE